ncbi:MAG TPA: hypothetical protein VHY56_01185, partial [Candidatus Binataceae bacterium]|nr:hypothetical protein [Candidatus Binataceae bacterium]
MSRITRNQVVELFGTPDHTTGSLNSPIELDDLGIHFNEKWTYDDLDADPAGVRMRTIYWHRYDFRGTRIRTSEAEEWHDDARLAEALAALPDRLEPITNDH